MSACSHEQLEKKVISAFLCTESLGPLYRQVSSSSSLRKRTPASSSCDTVLGLHFPSSDTFVDKGFPEQEIWTRQHGRVSLSINHAHLNEMTSLSTGSLNVQSLALGRSDLAFRRKSRDGMSLGLAIHSERASGERAVPARTFVASTRSDFLVASDNHDALLLVYKLQASSHPTLARKPYQHYFSANVYLVVAASTILCVQFSPTAPSSGLGSFWQMYCIAYDD